MKRNQVRNQVSDSVEHGFDKLHRIADRCGIYPLAIVEGAIQGAARGAYKMVTHKHPLDRATGDHHHGGCKYKISKPGGSAYGQPVEPHGYYGNYPPPPPPLPPAPSQFQYHPAFPVPRRPPY